MYLKISRENLRKWLTELKKGAEVLVPEKVNGLWTYTPFQGQDPLPNFLNSRIPPKSVFFPSMQALVEWKSSGGSVQLRSLTPAAGPKVLFGLRPCDARGLRILEPVFSQDNQDIFYGQNLSRTLLLGVACRRPCPGSFCEQMGIDPQAAKDFDLSFREITQGFIVKVITEKGGKLTGGGVFFTEAAAKEWEEARSEIKNKNETLSFDLEKVKTRVGERFTDEEFWMRVSLKCLNCGICTYLCPTCHCFDICDLQIPGQGIRFRCFDSCAFPGFTKMAVHNPREEKWRRYRQRVSHKFNFFPQNFQNVACVGCGRCVVHCPVNLDLRQVLLAISG